jgi:hypothetical protein
MTRRASPPPSPPLRQLAWALLVAGVLLDMLLSANALYRLGIPYDVPFGPFPAKIHPGSYLLVASYLAGLASHGNPLAVALVQARRAPLLATYLACMLLVFAWATGRHGPAGLAFMVDTLWLPAIAALSALLQDAGRRRWLLQLMLVLLALNSLVALGEYAVGRPLVAPAPVDGLAPDEFFRSSALLGHPLLNALVTVSLLPAVGLLPWPGRWRAAVSVLLALALLSYGGRSAIGVALAFGLVAALAIARRVLRGAYSYLQVTGGLLALVAGATALAAVVAATGLGERFFKNLKWDNSAAVRLRIWDMPELLHDFELWVGISVPQIEHLALRVGLDLRYEAVENFWLYLLLLLGVVGFIPFVAGIAALAVHLWRIAAAPMRLALVAYFVLASGANTLASKSNSLLLLTLVIQCAAARRPAPPPSPQRPRNTPWPARLSTGEAPS